MRTLNADQLKAVLSMESSLGHIHTLADVENTIDYLAREEPEAVAGVEKFNIFDTMWSRKIQAAFPQSFVNMQNELVFSLRTDSGFSLKDVTNETQLKAKILEWLTRTAIKAVSPKERKLHFEGINKLLGTNFTWGNDGHLYISRKWNQSRPLREVCGERLRYDDDSKRRVSKWISKRLRVFRG